MKNVAYIKPERKFEHKGEFLNILLNKRRLYVQEYLPIDCDLRIVWVGGRIMEAYWRICREIS